MSKKIIALSLATLLSMSAFVGCSSAETTSSDAAVSTEAPASETAVSTETTSETEEATTGASETGEAPTTTSTGNFANGSIDSISAASVNQYYQESSLIGEALMTAIANREGAVAVATTNPDGTPNIATVIPGVASENHLAFGIVPNQTTENLYANKVAVMSFYIYTADAEDKFERNKGARLVLKLVEDEATIAELRSNNPATTSDTTIFTEIVEVLPLG